MPLPKHKDISDTHTEGTKSIHSGKGRRLLLEHVIEHVMFWGYVEDHLEDFGKTKSSLTILPPPGCNGSHLSNSAPEWHITMSRTHFGTFLG